MRTGVAWLALGAAVAVTPAMADSVEFNVNGDALRVRGDAGLGQHGLEVEADWLHDQDDGDVLGAGVLMVNDAAPGRGALDAGLGAKVFGVSLDDGDADGTAFALGGRFRWTWPQWNRFAVAGHGYFAPEVTTGGEVDRYTELALRAEYLVLRNANVYLGYRNARAGNTVTGDTETVDSGLHLGIRLAF